MVCAQCGNKINGAARLCEACRKNIPVRKSGPRKSGIPQWLILLGVGASLFFVSLPFLISWGVSKIAPPLSHRVRFPMDNTGPPSIDDGYMVLLNKISDKEPLQKEQMKYLEGLKPIEARLEGRDNKIKVYVSGDISGFQSLDLKSGQDQKVWIPWIDANTRLSQNSDPGDPQHMRPAFMTSAHLRELEKRKQRLITLGINATPEQRAFPKAPERFFVTTDFASLYKTYPGRLSNTNNPDTPGHGANTTPAMRASAGAQVEKPTDSDTRDGWTQVTVFGTRYYIQANQLSDMKPKGH